MLKTFIGAFVLSALLIGCATPRRSVSHFSSYDDFQPGPKGGVDLVWARFGLRDHERLYEKLATYDSIVFDRIVVVMDEAQTLDQQDVDELLAYLQMRLRQKVSPYKTIVDTPRENSLRMSIAISNVETPNPVLAVTSSVLPFGLGISAISKVTTGEHTNVGSATIELLVSDAMTERPLFAVIDREAGNKDIGTMVDSLDDPKDAIDAWVERLGHTMKASHYH
uniref:DUF3313 domain-containing protein n=1 Tax=Thaumasiovibrio occultus TaxID=1891184 RepID=UPI000B3562CC|nr:DUF3313 domain-containing protein [Thaumasiovibrio occultus]